MAVRSLNAGKPNFNVDQVIPASIASRRLGEIRKNAKQLPQFISENNKIDSVILGYEQYEKMFMDLEHFRNLAWELTIAQRLKQADAHPDKRYTLEDVMSKEEYEEFCSIDANTISDDF